MPSFLRTSTVTTAHANCSTERKECSGMPFRASLFTRRSEEDTPTKHVAVTSSSNVTMAFVAQPPPTPPSPRPRSTLVNLAR
eukprot:scaffold13153_cov72-Phaeocystis_antarctica.AAC.2